MATKNQRPRRKRGRPGGTFDGDAADAAARLERLRRDGVGERAAARIVTAAESGSNPLRTAKQIYSAEAKQRQRARRARSRGVGPSVPSSLRAALQDAGAACTCERWPFYRFGGRVPEHSHCANPDCNAFIDVGAKFCGSRCYPSVFWGGDVAADAARMEARSDIGRDQVRSRRDAPHSTAATRPHPTDACCSRCGRGIDTCWTCPECLERFYGCDKCEPGQLTKLTDEHRIVCDSR